MDTIDKSKTNNTALNPKVWRILETDSPAEIEFARILPVSPIVSRVLWNRGIRDAGAAKRFLTPDLDDMHDPFLMDGMVAAVGRTREAIERKEKILIHGDYDVDGVTSAALLVRVFKILGADITWYVPHRVNDGYDIGLQAVERAKEDGVSLIITADCGTSAVESVKRANELGIDVIVTDHHEVGPEMAPALVVVNPHKPGCAYPFRDLAGVGVAFKFAEALVQECGYDTAAYRRRFCDLAAIGTVGDVVPLLGENRTLVKFGIEELQRTGKKGLKALLDVSGLTGRPIVSHSLAFALAPRLNAAGRMDDPSLALELCLTCDDAEAGALARVLDTKNQERQAAQELMYNEAEKQIITRGIESSKVFVLSSKGWHPGIVGIVAGKITEKHSRPSVLISMDEDGIVGVGSARSIDAFDLFAALMQCRDLLVRCGGHAKAAGLSVDACKLGEFEKAINDIADKSLTDEDMLPGVDVDTVIELDAVGYDLAHELRLLEPFGHANKEPVFMSEHAIILQKTRMGSTGSHLRLKLGRASGEPLECVAFGWGDKDEALRVGSLIDVCYNVQINQYGGRETVQMVLRDARPSNATISEPFVAQNIA